MVLVLVYFYLFGTLFGFSEWRSGPPGQRTGEIVEDVRMLLRLLLAL